MEGIVPKFLIEQNVSYYTVCIHNSELAASSRLTPFPQIPAALLMAVAPRVVTMSWYGRFFNSHYPRGLPDDIQLLPVNAVSPKVRGRLFRADAAMQNAIENLPLFAAAVVAGNASYLSAAGLNGCCIGYLLLRALYMTFYVFWQDSPAFPALTRTLIWLMGIAVEMYLFILAARQPRLVVVDGDANLASPTQPGVRFFLSGSIDKSEL
ncbi:hypothetical protein PG993_008925 [Apiospora rasikravindrae]|uniref:MAPEG family protein n=1 Tax=Apiospora rasikravindrae TaxID=990691 RepID=A0ABR1SPP6_9PEZI